MRAWVTVQPPTARRGRRWRLVPWAAVLVCAATAGCVGGAPHTHDANAIDTARGDALLADPWLDATQITVTRYAGGTNDLYLPTTTTVHRPAGDGAVAETIRAQVADARQAGWWPFYAQCEGVRGDAAALGDGVGVLLARELSDGSYAQAEMSDGLGDVVTIVATAANHDMVQPAPPAEIDVEALACLSPDGTGPDSVGDVVDLTKDW